MTFSEPSTSVAEDAGAVTVEVTVQGFRRSVVLVDYNTSAGTALAGLDYLAASGTLLFPLGEDSQSIEVTILDDGIFEGGEAFTVTLSNLHGLTPGDFTTAEIRIEDDEPAPWRMEAGTATLPRTLDAGAFSNITFAEPFDEPPLVFVSAVSSGNDPMTVRIRNVSITGFEAVQVEPAPMNGNHTQTELYFAALEPGVHELPDGTRIEAGSLSTLRATPPLAGRETVEFSVPFPSAPAFIAQLQTMQNETAVLPGSPSNPWLTVAVPSVSQTEAQIVLERSETGWYGVPAEETVAFLAVEAGALGSFADDLGAQVSFETGVTGASVLGWNDGCTTVPFAGSYQQAPLVVVSQMTRIETDGGWARLCALAAAGADIAIDEDTSQDSERSHAGEAVGLVAFDRPFAALVGGSKVALTDSSYTFDEASGAGQVLVGVTLSPPSAQPVSVDYATSPLSATPGLDYVEQSGTLSWAAGEDGEKTIAIDIIGDALDEANEKLRLELSDPVNATLGTDPAATIRIIDDDPSPSLSFGLTPSC